MMLLESDKTIARLLVDPAVSHWLKDVLRAAARRDSLDAIKFIVYGSRRHDEVDLEHSKFNEMMVPAGQYVDGNGSILKFSVVQDAENHKIHSQWKQPSRQ